MLLVLQTAVSEIQAWSCSFFIAKIHLKSRADFLNKDYIACPQCLVTVKYEAKQRMSSGFISSKIHSSKDLFILWICSKKKSSQTKMELYEKTKSSLEACISCRLFLELNTAVSKLHRLLSLPASCSRCRGRHELPDLEAAQPHLMVLCHHL